jgi:hypothetical protein
MLRGSLRAHGVVAIDLRQLPVKQAGGHTANVSCRFAVGLGIVIVGEPRAYNFEGLDLKHDQGEATAVVCERAHLRAV